MCQQHTPQKISFPEDPWIKFNNFNRSLQVPYIIYADIESYTQKINETTGNTTRYQHHIPSGFGYKVVGQTSFKSAYISASVWGIFDL